MTDSPKADAWFGRDYQMPWGYDPNNTGGRESIESNLVSTNRAAYVTLAEFRAFVAELGQRGGAPFYMVVRYDQTDWIARPGTFRRIESPDDYHFLFTSKWINTPHGAAPQVAHNLLSYIRLEATFGPAGGRIDGLPPAPAAGVVRTQTTAQVRADCPICAEQDAAAATAVTASQS